jgi:hypothetical protein
MIVITKDGKEHDIPCVMPHDTFMAQWLPADKVLLISKDGKPVLGISIPRPSMLNGVKRWIETLQDPRWNYANPKDAQFVVGLTENLCQVAAFYRDNKWHTKEEDFKIIAWRPL